MKRYVKELANDIIKHDKENMLMQRIYKDRREQAVMSILSDCESGFMSDFEAVNQLVNIKL